ncbi:N-acetyltransferase family protein [Aerococcaceae bacterium DSM 111021]|nr:N-acetyltransferase family protein [Aerococcaceae bacterium DSM 111021]
MIIRMVEQKDYKNIWNIYRQYIETPITFEHKMPTPEEFETRLESIIQNYACIVCEVDDEILGYAYAHRFAERAGYNWTAELSVYTDSKAKGLGGGRQLYEKLLELCKLQGIHTVYGLVTENNSASENLHEKLGFRLAGVFRNVGFKEGRWLSCSYYEKDLASYNDKPNPMKSISDIKKDDIKELLSK